MEISSRHYNIKDQKVNKNWLGSVSPYVWNSSLVWAVPTSAMLYFMYKLANYYSSNVTLSFWRPLIIQGEQQVGLKQLDVTTKVFSTDLFMQTVVYTAAAEQRACAECHKVQTSWPGLDKEVSLEGLESCLPLGLDLGTQALPTDCRSVSWGSFLLSESCSSF